MSRQCLLLVACLFLSGCSSEVEPTVDTQPPKAPQPVSVVLVDVPDIAGELSRQWSARQNGTVTVENIALADLTKDDYAILDGKDVLVYPSRMMGQLVKDDLLAEFSDEAWSSETLNAKGWLRDARTRQIILNDKRWGVPLGGPNLFLLCREDILEKYGCKVPTTWDALVEVTERINAVAQTSNSLPRTTHLPSSDKFMVDMFLALAAAEVRHRGRLEFVFERDTMKPLIAAAPFVEALSLYKKLLADSPSNLSPIQVAQNFYSGKAVMAIGWPAKAFFDEKSLVDAEDIVEHVGVHPIPGSQSWFEFSSAQWQQRETELSVSNIGFAAFQASILKSANYPTDTYAFLKWLGSKQTCSMVWSNSLIGAPSRESHLGNPVNWTGEVLTVDASDRYAELVRDINNQTVSLTFPRIPGATLYLTSLSNGIARYLNTDEENSQAVLNTVAAEWDQITDRLGREDQADRLRMDFGL